MLARVLAFSARNADRILLEHLFYRSIDLVYELSSVVAEFLFGHASPRDFLVSGIDKIDDELPLMYDHCCCRTGHSTPQQKF